MRRQPGTLWAARAEGADGGLLALEHDFEHTTLALLSQCAVAKPRRLAHLFERHGRRLLVQQSVCSVSGGGEVDGREKREGGRCG